MTTAIYEKQCTALLSVEAQTGREAIKQTRIEAAKGLSFQSRASRSAPGSISRQWKKETRVRNELIRWTFETLTIEMTSL